MTRKYQPAQYADPRGIVVEGRVVSTGLVATGSGAPTAGRAGYAKGCLYVNDTGSVGSLLYINTGSTTSATWTIII